MASSTLTGDRRWGQTRKSGMTVLGKVPKPINLPSQRLENHGLDPNVEIVPKGTLTWGSRPSLTASNAWGSSSLSSPITDGSPASPGCLSGRPSSGGSYTRPSTSASDRSHQATSSAWGPNSRPSSASGILPSNQTSAAVTRPRSAETRPGSSQFSCYPVPVAESAAWGVTRTADKLVSASKSNTFTLSSGDFPTLGSEKNPKLNVVLQDHSSQGCPTSASGRVSGQKEPVESPPTGNQTTVQLDKGNVNTWRQDNGPYTGSAVPPSSGNWHSDQQAYPRANAPSQQFDSWLGAPMQSSPDGIWYRSGPPGGVYRPGGPPGSYPVEPYIYFPHLPARPLSNSQACPRHGPVAGGHGPMNGVPYRPHTPDSYMVSNHPVRSMMPEVYPHQVHYENYYGPTPNPGNGNKQDGPVLGMAPCSTLLNQHLNQNLNMDSENFHAVPCYYAPSVANEQAETGHAHEIDGPQYKVLLKQHDDSKDGDSEGNRDQSITDSVGRLELGDSRSAQKKGSKDEPVVIIQPARGPDVHSLVPTVHKDVVVSTKCETADDHCSATAGKGEDPPRYFVKRNSTLIEKIGSRNNKARLADGRSVVPAFVGEENNKQFMNVNTKTVPTKEANTGATMSDKSSAEKVSFDGGMEHEDDREAANQELIVDVKGQSMTSGIHTSAVGLLGPSDVGFAARSTHRRVHGKQNRADKHAKSMFNGQDVEEWRKKSPGMDSSGIDILDNCPVSRVQDYQPCQDAFEKKEFQHMKVGDDKYSVSSMDPAEYKAKHAKMKEIARQRAKQLQEEEEERIREQKARALAKLEELNRTLAESSNQTVRLSPSNEAQSGQDPRCPDLKSDTTASKAPNSNSTSAIAVVQKADKVNSLGVLAVLKPSESVNKHEKSVDPCPQSVSASVIHNDLSLSLMQEGMKKEGKTDLQFHDDSVSKQKQTSQKRPDNHSEEKRVFENVSIGVVVGSIIVGSKSLGESAPPSSSTSDGTHSIIKDVDGPSIQHKKRNNRTAKNKSILDEAPSSAILQSSKKIVDDVKTEGCKPKPCESLVKDDTPVLYEASNETVGCQKFTDVAAMSANQVLSEGTGVPSKATVQWRPQPPKRVTRNPQSSKPVDKFHGTEAVVWAPVKPSNSMELSEEVQKVTDKANPDSSGKTGNDMEHSLRSKRAEMERYVPKPIAKELAHQETSQQLPSPCLHQAASGSRAELGSEGITDRELDHSATVKMEVPSNTKNGENNRPNRHGRAHASWRRRGPPESSSPLPSLLEGSSSSDSNKDTQKASCLQQPTKHDNSQKEQPKVSDVCWNDDNNCMMQCEPNIAPSVDKDHAKMNRGRRQPFKGHKSIGNSSSSRDNWEPGHGKTDKAMSQMMTIEADESSGRKTIRTESQSASGHPRSQWKPKTQTPSTPNHFQETTETEVQRVTLQGDRCDKGSSLPWGGNHDQPVENKSVSRLSTEITFPAEIRNPRHHEAKRERRVREESFIRQSRAPNRESSIVPELVPQNAESQNEPISSGARHHGQHGGWLARGQEISFGGDSGQGLDAGKHNLPANVDRHKQYQRAGYYDKQNDSFQHGSAVGEEAQNVSKPMGKYREWGHNHPRRGGHVYSQNRTSDTHGNGD